VAALDEALLAAERAEDVVVAAIAKTPAEGLAGLIIKARVWAGLTGNFNLARSMMNDLRRLGGEEPLSMAAFLEYSGMQP
jgi:hypothetical protein